VGRKDIWPIKNPCSTNRRGSPLEQVEEDLRRNRLTQVHLENGRETEVVVVIVVVVVVKYS